MIKKSITETLNGKYRGVPAAFSVEDEFFSKKNISNSWFYVGKCEADGHQIRFLYHILALKPNNGMSILNTIFSVTDLTTGWYDSIDSVIPFDDNSLSDENGKLKVIAPTGELNGDLNCTKLKAKMKSAELDVEIKHYGDVILNGGTGSFPLLFTKVNYQYSIPFSDMKGKLIIEGKEYEVDGNCWLDRQFSPVADGLNAWDETLLGSSKWAWMGIILSNGEAISLWEIVDHKDNRNIFASILHADGTQIVTSAKSIIDSATDKWESKVTGQNYPTKWIVDIPEVNAHLTVTCNPKEQEIVSELEINNKYEAMSIVTGTYAGKAVTGDCCLEVIGNWKK